MLQAPDNSQHAERLRELRDEYTMQERFMAAALRELQTQLDSYESLNTENDTDAEELREETQELTIDLSHIRMAIVGTQEELANHAEDIICRVTYRRLGA